VVFLPATLVASIYGMNFKFMPELDWVWVLESGLTIPMGYIFALGLMILASVLTMGFFKYKKWL
jgi:magnesium transporter